MWGLGPTRTMRLPEEGRRREGARKSRQRSRVRLATNPYTTCSEKGFRVRKSREGGGRWLETGLRWTRSLLVPQPPPKIVVSLPSQEHGLVIGRTSREPLVVYP